MLSINNKWSHRYELTRYNRTMLSKFR